MVTDRPDKKQSVTLQFRGVVFHQEDNDSQEECLSQALEYLRQANTTSPFPPLSNLKYDATFIEPFALPFHELVDLMKRRYFRSNELLDPGSDVGITVDYHEGEIVKHLQIGPMEAAQLQSNYLKWPLDEIPDCFLYIYLGYERQREAEFDLADIHKLFDEAVQWQLSQARKILSTLEQEAS